MRAIKRINALNEIKRNSRVGANSGETIQYQRRCAKALEKVRYDFLRLIIIMVHLKLYLLIGTIYLKRSNRIDFYWLVCSQLTCDKGEVT